MPNDEQHQEEAHKYENRDASAHRGLLYGNCILEKNRADDLTAVARNRPAVRQVRYFNNITRIRPSEW